MAQVGYTGKDELDAEVQKAYAAGMGQFGANGGSGGGGMASDMMNLVRGMKMYENMSGKMDGVFGGNKSAGAAQPAQPVQATGWNCACGMTNIQTNFCPQCGTPKPAPAETWTCTCGKSGITTKFCPECGKPKPAPAEAWTCTCGKTGITTKENAFVPNPVKLIPYRTFLEVQQPQSEFVFRISEGMKGAPMFKLVAADGGLWKNQAMDNVKRYLVDNVKRYLVEQLADIPDRDHITIIA